MTHLSTRILKPSLHQSFEEKFVDSLEAIPANRSVAQGSEKAKKTQDTYGHISESTSGQLDLFGAFSKMSEVTPRWGYGESCPIWKKMVTELSGDCSARRKQARLTNASDASSWPTATARDHKGCYKTLVRKDGKPRGDLLPDAVNIAEQNWATPQASDHVEGARTAKESNQKCLGRDLNQMNWATPQSRDFKGARRKLSEDGKNRSQTTGETFGKDLNQQVNNLKQNWPTPRAGNPGSRKPGTGGKILAEEAKKNWPTPRETMSRDATHDRGKCNLGEVVHGIENQHNGPPAPEKSNTSGKNHGSPKLNPNWVEQLMGLSTGWTDLGSWGMELSPKQQN